MYISYTEEYQINNTVSQISGNFHACTAKPAVLSSTHELQSMRLQSTCDLKYYGKVTCISTDCCWFKWNVQGLTMNGMRWQVFCNTSTNTVQNMNAIVEISCCICGVVAVNGSLCSSLWYKIHCSKHSGPNVHIHVHAPYMLSVI